MISGKLGQHYVEAIPRPGLAREFDSSRRCWTPSPATTTTSARTGRYHTAVPPAVSYAARPKATPGNRAADTHDRVRTDTIDANGTVTVRHGGSLYHVGVGRTHARTHVILLIQDLQVRIVDAATGELLRDLTLDPALNYQPTGNPRRPRRQTPEPTWVHGVLDVLRDHTSRDGGI